jgi:hypothetical protein
VVYGASQWSRLYHHTITPEAYITLYCMPQKTSGEAMKILLQHNNRPTELMVDRCICLVFVIGIRGSRQQDRPPETQAKTLDDFSQTIRHLHSVSPLTSRLIMWAVLVVAYASDYASFGDTARSLMEWMLKSYPEANSWETLRNVLQDFLWCNKAGLEKQWHTYWTRIKTTAEHSEL